MVLNAILGSLALLSLVLTLWQWLVARQFPLHQRGPAHSFPPALSLLKPLKGCDTATEACLRSWFAQDYTGRVQILFGVASAEDPVCQITRKLIQEFPASDAQLIICGPLLGANAKVSKLVELERLAKHDILVISDADVRVPPDFLANIAAPLRESHAPRSTLHAPTVGLVTCFYRLANPSTLAMQWEAVAINADFWSQVLQAGSLKPIDFALGAVMATTRKHLQEIGGFTALVDCLADDYQLGNRIARRGHRITVSPVVCECWAAPMGWKAVWKHQLRWARTVRVCQPVPYFFSILGNATLWPLLWVAAKPTLLSLIPALLCWVVRVATAHHLQSRLLNEPRSNVPEEGSRHSSFAIRHSPAAPKPDVGGSFLTCGLVPVKDLLQVALWLLAFAGNRIEWRGERMRLRRDGTLVRAT